MAQDPRTARPQLLRWPRRWLYATSSMPMDLEGRCPVGAALMTYVLMRWTHVSDGAFRVLTRMAVTALDEPSNGNPAEMYFAGRELLAMSLREPFPTGDDEAAAR